MKSMHTSPEDAVLAHQLLNSYTSVGIHFGTFAQADDGEFEPVEDLAAALQKTGYPHPHFWIMQNGESRDVPPVPAE